MCVRYSNLRALAALEAPAAVAVLMFCTLSVTHLTLTAGIHVKMYYDCSTLHAACGRMLLVPFRPAPRRRARPARHPVLLHVLLGGSPFFYPKPTSTRSAQLPLLMLQMYFDLRRTVLCLLLVEVGPWTRQYGTPGTSVFSEASGNSLHRITAGPFQ